MSKIFGTDGIRCLVNEEPLSAETCLKISKTVAFLLKKKNSQTSRVVICKDTRLSGYLYEPLVTAGFISMGMDVILVGPLPTPAVPLMIKTLRADIGVMITASHNTYEYNGLKFFDSTGTKLSSSIEQKVEKIVLDNKKYSKIMNNTFVSGNARRLEDASGRYSEFLKSDYRERLNDFKPRFGQEDAIANITQNLLKYNKCLFAGHTGIGKTLISEIATLRYFSELNKGGLVLVTTPIPDTLNSFIDNLNTINVGHTQFQKYSFITKKEWDNLSITDICKRKKDEVIFLLLTAQDLFYDDKTGSKIRNKYKQLDGCVDLWLRDEGHKFYRGDRTSTLLDCINSTSILDLSATPYNFLDTYNDETIVNYDLLWGLNNRQETKLPKISIESYETPFAGLNDRIKKAYNDEKHLFHQNAKCTLYGSSDSVTALTYDDHNNIIHAGTSSGRSDFQGLNRINNTTTAVTTMISASNGLIAEQ